MAKKTRALSGASQDAYFRRVLKTQPGLSAEERDRLVVRLRHDIAQLRLRTQARAEPEVCAEPAAPPQAPPPPTVVAPAAAPFDPYSPNVILVLRKSGRDAALAALGAIESSDHLRLLAREQRLAVPADLIVAADLRAAIVSAAERRVANRMAAAG